MSELLSQAAGWLSQQHKAHNSRSVTYRRGAESVVLQATVGRTEYEQTDDDGVVTTMRVRDYMLPAADLVLGGEVTLPEQGDRIEESDGGQLHTYLVLPAADGELFRYADPYRVWLRVHAKEIEVTEE